MESLGLYTPARWRVLICLTLCFGLSRLSSGQLNYTDGYGNATHIAMVLTTELQKSLSLSVTQTLNQLLRNYNRHLRPNFGGSPAVINANLFIRSMGPISESDMTYSMDAYFRQTWVDERLKFSGSFPMLVLDILLLNNIWKPDTYFHNGQGSYLHMTTRPNKLLRIYQNGRVLYSMRITIKATCPMYLQSFPMDEQFCPLTLGSYTYTNKDVLYKWMHGGKPVSRVKGLKLSQFDLRGIEIDDGAQTRPSGNFSTLEIRFQLQRQLGYFIIQVYVPCSLVVVLSWVSFWLHREATADRIGLGVTAILTLTTMSMEGRGSLPATKYGTYLDWFFFKCFTFVLASILEFAGVHYFTKFDFGDQQETEIEEDAVFKISKAYVDDERENLYSFIGEGSHQTNISGKEAEREEKGETHVRDSFFLQFFKCLQSNIEYKKQMVLRGLRRKKDHVNSVSAIDKVARIVFPLSFTTLTIMYWVRFYL